ncbi:phage coat protein [Rodentibacter rarus]|uniref:major capsid protein n=1 Tax=Rodentibacter rarus TaxID=1908260 RepID=UPI00098746F7|nr:major capsid protein [Rodentibacter rarus]OOF39892.1 phage coat protein [Rodentibacter rarus]
MERIIFNKNLITNSIQAKQAWDQLLLQRKVFNTNQSRLAAEYGQSLSVNQAALLDKDYWREVDMVTTRVFRDDQGNPILDDLLSLGTSISIGKTVAMYRVSSDAGVVTRSMSGQVPESMDKVIYDQYGDPIPIFSTGYGREWREWQGLQSENIDAMSDDQEAAVAALRANMAKYVLLGDDKLIVNNFAARGITNHENTNQIDLGASGLNINLTTADADDVIKFFTGNFAKVLDDNLVGEKVKIWVSPEINRNLDRPYSNANGYKEGTIKDYILKYGRVESIEPTFALKDNHFIAYVRNAQYLKTRIAAPIGTFMIPRQNPFDNYQSMVWSAFGLQVKRDFNGKSKVFNAKG